MLDEQRPRHLPAGRDFIRKRHPFAYPRATASDDLPLTAPIVFTAPITAPITLTFISTISAISTSTSSSTSSSAKSSTTKSLSSSIVSSSTSSLPTSTSSVPVPSVSVVPTSSPTGSTATENAMKMSSTPTSGLSGGAVAAIAIGVLVLVASAAVLIFRRTMQKRRAQKRTTARWLSGFAANPAAGGPSGPFSGPEKFGNNPPMNAVASPSYGDGYAFTGTLTSGNGNRAIGSGAVSPTAPPASYNNPPTTAGFSPRAASANIMNKASVVRYTFVPNLPDELAILNGEVLDVLQEYDDGWALCTNSKGEMGMVPLECLSSGSETSLYDFGERSRRSSRRVSSLSGKI